jgi:hypothetical protein
VRDGLTALDKQLRPFNIGQSTPPVGPTNTVSHTFFNEDSSALITTVKGDPTKNNTGFLSVFPVENGVVCTKDVQSSPNGTAVLFGSALIPGTANKFLTTDASFGSAIVSLDSNNIGSISGVNKIADQKATCWSVVSDASGTGFVTDVGVNHIVEVNLNTGAQIRSLNLTNGNPGLIDMAAGGTFVYALSPGNGKIKTAVTVLDVSGGPGTAKEIQNFNPTGAGANSQGMTILV